MSGPDPQVLRVVLADGHPLLVAALSVQLAASEGLEVVGSTTIQEDVVKMVDRLGPDVLLIDLSLADGGEPHFAHLRTAHPALTIVALVGTDEPGAVARALRLGAHAVVAKTIDTHDLPAVLRQTVRRTFFHPAGEPAADGVLQLLTPRQRDVLELLVSGARDNEIARELCLTEATVKYHLTRIYGSFGVSNRTEAARVALRLGVRARPADPFGA